MQSCSVAALTPASLTIQANNANIFQGQTLPLLTATYRGFVNGETSANLTTQPQINTSGNSASPQGNYPIIASGAASPNYTISYQNGHLQITAAPLPPVNPPPPASAPSSRTARSCTITSPRRCSQSRRREHSNRWQRCRQWFRKWLKHSSINSSSALSDRAA